MYRLIMENGIMLYYKEFKTMLRKTIVTVLVISLVCSSFSYASAENGFDLGTGLEIRGGRFLCTPMDDGSEAVLIMDPVNGGMLYTIIIDAATIAADEKTLIESLLSKGRHELDWAVLTVTSELRKNNETTWTLGTSNMEGEDFDTVIGVNGTTALMALSIGMSEEVIGEVMGSIHRYNSATASPSKVRVKVSAEMLPGFYDLEFYDSFDQDINLILSPKGNGRVINSSGSVTFKYSVKDGEIITDDVTMQMWLDPEGRVNLAADTMTLRFVKRGYSSSDAAQIAGIWKLKAMILKGQRLDRALLSAAGISIVMTVYENGAIDWYAVTDEEATLAQGWGKDNGGYYFKNGEDIYTLKIDGEEMEITFSSGDQALLFERTEQMVTKPSESNEIPEEEIGNDPISLYRRGLAYENGNGVVQSYGRALEYYQKAASAGSIEAMAAIGNVFRYGRDVSRDYAEAMKWFRRAANAGNAEALFSVGFLYERGYGVDRDYALAKEWYEKAVKAGSFAALCEIGVLYESGYGVILDDETAKDWYNRAADVFSSASDTDNADAKYLMGYLYHHGYGGIERDYQKAFSLYLEAANAGSEYAMNNLALLYIDGLGIQSDEEAAMSWLLKAAENDNEYAMNNIGVMYEYGIGVEEDMETARQWYDKAVAAGY